MVINDETQEKKLSVLENKKLERLGVWSEVDPSILGISSDSKKILKGFIFFAISGETVHGATYIDDAIDRGAIIVVTDMDGMKIISEQEVKISIIVVDNPRKKLAQYAALWNGKQPKFQIAVTGTNGKTSVCYFVRKIWENLGNKAVNIGTLGVQGEVELPLSHTTPDPVTLHKIFKKLVDANVDHVAMEASSHGLDQFRLDGVFLRAAAYTNLSRDHLDYHASEEDYLVSKCALFDRVLPSGQVVVVNIDDPYGHLIKLISENRKHKVITVGVHEAADIKIQDQRFNENGQTLKFSYLGISRTVDLNLIGAFQATNVLTAAGLAIALGSAANQVFDILPKLTNAPGRMQLVGKKKSSANIYIDYAHTPDALQKALTALRPHTIGRLVLVFGAGGDRDKGKRPLMGKIAAKHADEVFVTDDNPRTESPRDIRAEILKECPTAIEIPDRAAAILAAVENIKDGDVLLISGKGHETFQIVGDDKFPFDDSEYVSMSISLLEGKKI